MARRMVARDTPKLVARWASVGKAEPAGYCPWSICSLSVSLRRVDLLLYAATDDMIKL